MVWCRGVAENKAVSVSEVRLIIMMMVVVFLCDQCDELMIVLRVNKQASAVNRYLACPTLIVVPTK